ncbi:MAG TPA: Crp/Fnr family transcriptional regulator [Caulobacteraceae bacterium]|jgi:CRP-like cAMP-binding protein
MDNQWLASLDKRDRARLDPHMTVVDFERGRTLFEAGADLDAVWFPTGGVVSLMTLLDGGKMVETAAIGREGLVGVTCGPLNGRANSRAVTNTAGSAMRMDAAAFSQALERSEALRAALARYTESLFAQVQQVAACNAQHRIEDRLARWLLMLHDRADGDRFELTQEGIAEMLGVRRATVSEIGSGLESKGLIRRGRGLVEILDRPSLEQASCSCYGAIRDVMAELDIDPGLPKAS